ncbi:MAG: hypothetical protein HRU25_14905, partial [Psychrobium sp.]|nr:hypothetical protein [Psychrobium sp.]
RAVYQSVLSYLDKTWQAGRKQYGLLDGWVDLVRDRHNMAVYTQPMQDKIDGIAQLIIEGRLPQLSALNDCAKESF